MALNDAVIVGPPRCMILFKPPANPAPEHRQLLNAVDIVGTYKDGYFLATASQSKLSRLRDAGAEVIVLDADANHFIAETKDLSEGQYVAMVDERVDEARSELAIADRGRDRGTGGAA
jgi:hypothetical protein